MGEDMEKIKWWPAEESPWYWISRAGYSVWNRYMHEVCIDDEAEILHKESIPPFSREEKYNLIRQLSKSSNGRFSDPTDEGYIHLELLDWKKHKSFHKHIFPAHTTFRGSQFYELYVYKCNFQFVDFCESIFNRITRFDNCTFDRSSLFYHSIFTRLDISGCKFKSQCSFSFAKINNGAIFKKAVFIKGCEIRNIESKGDVLFDTCTFYKDVSFEGSHIEQSLIFRECTFQSPPNLIACKIEGNLEIDKATLASLAKLPPKTEERDHWLKLKYEMNRLHRHREEADFFTKELECRALDGDWKEKFLITLYRSISDFGRSALLPLGALVYFFILFTALYEFTLFDANGSLEYSSYLSSKATFPFIPKDIALSPNLGELNFSPTKEFFIRMTQGVQFIISATLLFLIGLGIRNRLRIK